MVIARLRQGVASLGLSFPLPKVLDFEFLIPCSCQDSASQRGWASARWLHTPKNRKQGLHRKCACACFWQRCSQEPQGGSGTGVCPPRVQWDVGEPHPGMSFRRKKERKADTRCNTGELWSRRSPAQETEYRRVPPERKIQNGKSGFVGTRAQRGGLGCDCFVGLGFPERVMLFAQQPEGCALNPAGFIL